MKQTIIDLTVNGDRYSTAVQAHLTLVELLRDVLHLTGTKLGCGTGDCGACTVNMNGKTVNSCLTLALEADGAEIPMDFEPEEAEDIAEEIMAAARAARSVKKKG